MTSTWMPWRVIYKIYGQITTFAHAFMDLWPNALDIQQNQISGKTMAIVAISDLAPIDLISEGAFCERFGGETGEKIQKEITFSCWTIPTR